MLTRSLSLGIMRLGALLNQIPFKADALVWLDGTISGNNFVDKISGKLFPITAKDFSSNWTKGFPLKSKATFSAPAGDATLIAADVNNFWYTSGTPNQIPVNALSHGDMDFEHKFYFKNKSAITIPIFGIEIYEPRVTDIVIYNTVKTGGSISICQAYYNVQAEVSTNVKWVAKNGLDTNAGTKASPYLTITKGKQSITSGGTVYVKTGSYTENESNLNLLLNVAGNYIGTGNVKVLGSSATTSIAVVYVFNAGSIVVKGLTVDCNSVYRYGIDCDLGNATIQSCRTLTPVLYSIRNLSPNCLIKNCIVTKEGVLSNATNVEVNACYIETSGTNYSLVSAVGTGVISMYYCKVAPVSTASPCVLNFGASGTFNYKWNYFDLSALTDKSLIIYTAGKTQVFNAWYNTIFSSNTNTVKIIDGMAATCVSTNDYRYNKFEFTNTGNFGTCIIMALYNQVAPVIIGNRFITNTAFALPHIDIRSLGAVVGNATITGNFHTSKSTSGYVIKVGEEASNAYDNLITPIITGNKIISALSFNPAATGNTHTIFVGYNINPIIRYNFINGGFLGIVIKHAGGVNTTDKITANILYNCAYGLLIKGADGIKLYGNTVYSTIASARGISDEAHVIATSNLKIRNNIIKCAVGIDITDGGHVGMESNNNVLNTTLNVKYRGVYKTWAEWQALGFDVNSQNTDPVLDANLIPTTPIMIGENLGVNYEDGLDVLANWGNDTTLPVIVTKKQPTTGNWQVGAYVA